MNRKLFLALTAICTLPVAARETSERDNITKRDACTSILCGRNATKDHSVITSHTCDSWYRTWMNMQLAQDFKNDTTIAIMDGTMHTEFSDDESGTWTRGYIPQPKGHAYRYLNTAYPCLNEHQLAMGETTFGGREELQNKDGLFMIEELARVAMMRCTKAKDAVRLMGSLAEKYGYGDGGECLTVADTEEAWIFEIMGAGKKKKGAVWAAIRIPDDEICISANVSRIDKVDIMDTANCMASKNVYTLAKEMKWWDGKEVFSFWRAYSGGNYFNEPKNYSVRELYIMQQLAPSRHFTDSTTNLPLSVRPDTLVDVQRVSDLLASYYKGTDQNLSARLKVPNTKKKNPEDPDSIISVKANPWMQPDEMAVYHALGDSAMQNIRTVSVSWCAYSTVIQLRSWLPDAIGGVAWIALDNPGESPRFPVFAGCTELPRMLRICGQHRDRDDAALTHFRHANRLATVRWGKTCDMIVKAKQHYMQKGLIELPQLEVTWKATPEAEQTDLLNDYTADFLGAEISRWDDLAHRFWRMLWVGF